MAGETGKRVWRFGRWIGVAAFILAVPLAAMQFTREVAWTASDFVFAGALILGVGFAYELAAMRGNAAYRAATAFALATAFLTVWFTGAVGIIGDEGNPANLMFGGVLAVALLGAALARFRPAGMSSAMIAAACAQALVAAVALAMGWGGADPSYPWDIVGCTGFFVVLWCASALLFRTAARAAPARP
jgi:hypothetical protein